MPKCRICEHNNPVGIDRCQNCGSWIEQAVPSKLSGQEPKTDSDERVPQQPDSLEGRVLFLMQAGKKIEAVKLYRQETGSGLKEAKDAVEALAAGQPIARRSGESVETNGVDPNSLEGQVLALMRGQKKIWAIKVYREKTGVGLKQAKDAVEALAAKHGINPKGAGCAGMVLLMVVLSTIIGMWTLPR
jgi:ribosomal protein L7/L12